LFALPRTFIYIIDILKQHCNVTLKHSLPLGRWVKDQRKKKRLKTLPKYQEEKLLALGMRFETSKITWDAHFKNLSEYKKAHGVRKTNPPPLEEFVALVAIANKHRALFLFLTQLHLLPLYCCDCYRIAMFL